MRKPHFALVILVLFFAALSIQAQTIERKTATVSGRVVLKGEPARNALICLRSHTRDYLRARTDDNGQYRISGVAAGAYRVMALTPGFISSDFSAFLQGKTLNVSEGENIENVDFELKRGGVITGRVTDSQGSPLVDEHVTLRKLDNKLTPHFYNAYDANFEMFQTDDRGVYRIYGLPEGRYMVSAGGRHSAGIIAAGGVFYPLTFHPDAATESEAKVIEVSEGSENTNIDIILPAAKQTRAVYGRVVNAETGKPVAGVEISLGVKWDDGRYYNLGMYEARSSANGEFHLAGIESGKYVVFPRINGYNEFIGEPAPCDLSEGDAHDVEVKVRPGGSISGSVVIEGTNDPMAPAKLPQLHVYVKVQTDAPRAPRMENPKINADGSFRIRGLPPCVAHIQYNQSPDYRGLALVRIERDGAPIRDGIKVGAGEHVTGVRVVMTYATFPLRGEVKISGGAMPAGLRLYAVVRRTDKETTSSAEALVDSRGQFVIEGLAPGEYGVTIQPFRDFDSDPIDPRIWRAFSSLAETRVIVDSGPQQVTFSVDLSRKEEDK